MKMLESKKRKNDEFYTRYRDIDKEIDAYFKHDAELFRNKTVYCPCDDLEKSNFAQFFLNNFSRYGLKKLIVSSLGAGRGKFFIKEDTKQFSGSLKENGDFRSLEACAFRDTADLIITNPPFSLFRDFVSWIGDKDFIILGPLTAAGYKNVFPLLKERKISFGSENRGRKMAFTTLDGEKIFSSIRWFTSLDCGVDKNVVLQTASYNLENNQKLKKKLLGDYGVDFYPKYANFDALEVPYVDAIPADIFTPLGVPITFFDKYDPNQFDVLGKLDNPIVIKNGESKKLYKRILIQQKKNTRL